MVLKLLYSPMLLKRTSVLTSKLAVIAQQRLLTSKTTSIEPQPFNQPPLDFAKLQKFKSFNVIPKGLLIKNINCKKAGIDIYKLKNLSIGEFGLICDNYFSKRELPLVQSDGERLQLALISHLMLSKIDSESNQLLFEQLVQFIDGRIGLLLPLTYIPLLNNLKLNRNYRLWICFFTRMRFDDILFCNEELITDLVEDLIPQLNSLANNSATKRRADNSIDYINLSINENLDFEVLTDIVVEYGLLDRVPNKLIVNIILDIAKEIVAIKWEDRNYTRDRWVSAALDLLLKTNDLKAAYSLYNDQPIKSLRSIHAFLCYFGKTCNKKGLEEFWGEFESNKVTPYEWSYRMVLEAYLSMGDLKGVKLILNKLVNQTEVRLDSQLTRLVIERLITTEPQNFNYILTIINSSYFDNTYSYWKYEMILISLVEYTKIDQFDQLDHFDKLFNLSVKELYIYFNRSVASYSKYVEKCNKEFYEGCGEDYYEDYDAEEHLLNLCRYPLFSGYFEKLIKFNQDFHGQDNIERFFKTIIEPIVYAEYPSTQLRNSILNDLLISLSSNIFLLKNGDITILIKCIELIQANFKDFEFREEFFDQLIKDEVNFVISNKVE